MQLEMLSFWVLAAAAVACAVGMVTAKSPIHAALWLVGNFVSLGVIYLLLSAPVLFAVQLIVYAGAIMVLFLFVIMFFMSPQARQWLHPPLRSQNMWAGIAGIALTGLLAYGISEALQPALGGGTRLTYADPFKLQDLRSTHYDPAVELGATKNGQSNPERLGEWLFSYQVLPFELTSLLLLAALLGAIMIARDVREEGRTRIRHTAPVAHPESSTNGAAPRDEEEVVA